MKPYILQMIVTYAVATGQIAAPVPSVAITAFAHEYTTKEACERALRSLRLDAQSLGASAAGHCEAR